MRARWGAKRHRRGPDRGAFTAEFAAALPALVLLLGVGLVAVDAVTDKLRCVDAAREAALAAARGGEGEAAGRAVAPAAATVSVRVGGDAVTATVSSPVLGTHGLSSVTVAATAVAALEPGQP